MESTPARATFTFAADRTDGRDVQRHIDAYLPRGWHTQLDADGRTVTIHGNDHAGWTLHDYVLPRLASGCIYPVSINDNGQ